MNSICAHNRVMIGMRGEREIYVKWSNGDEGSVLVTHAEKVNRR